MDYSREEERANSTVCVWRRWVYHLKQSEENIVIYIYILVFTLLFCLYSLRMKASVAESVTLWVNIVQVALNATRFKYLLVCIVDQ